MVGENPQKFGDSYYQYPISPCPARIPYKDKVTNKMVHPEAITLMPKFRCPGCGRAVSARKVYNIKEKPVGKDQTDGREDGIAGPEIPTNTP